MLCVMKYQLIKKCINHIDYFRITNNLKSKILFINYLFYLKENRNKFRLDKNFKNSNLKMF